MPNQVREKHRSQSTGGKQSIDERGRSGTCDRTECVGGLSRAEAFSLLGNEDRLAILEVVIQAKHHDSAPYPLSFSTLRDAVAIRDSGRFSYHLQELTGHFLTRTPAGYALHETCCERLQDVLFTCLDTG